tara:strand:- start:350 stop:499 length:150 start_codon:yes stop_codon:yes gene_type:complete
MSEIINGRSIMCARKVIMSPLDINQFRGAAFFLIKRLPAPPRNPFARQS